jgi:glycosyltransferase involved in cell wall biosynthesis
MSKRLLLIGSQSVHVSNYCKLIKPYFDEVFLISNELGEDLDGVQQELVNFSYLKVSNYFSTVRKIRSICSDFKPDVIHIHQVNSVSFFSVLALKNFNIPLVITAWGSDVLLLPNKSFVFTQIVKYCLKHADAVTADAEYLCQEVMKFMPAGKASVVLANFGIELNDELFTQRQNIIYSNRLHKPLYNVDEIIRSFKRLEDTGRNVYRLVIAASGEETENLKRLTADLNLTEKVDFVGWLSLNENLKWYAKSKFYMSIPDSDATSISLLEAMYYGSYPIVSSLPSKREWISDEVNGSYYKGDIGFILDMDDDILNRVAEINKRVIMKKGTVEVAFQKFTKIYQELGI